MASKRNTDLQKLRTLRRRTLVFTYLTAALILLPLAMIRKWDSRVFADVTVRGLAFDFAGTGALIDSRPYLSVHLRASARVELRLGDRIMPMTISPEGSLAIERPHLDSLQIERGARVSVVHNDPSTLTVSVSGGAAAVNLTVPRQATIECEYCDVGGVAHDRYVNMLAEGGNVKLYSETSPLHLLLETGGSSVIANGLLVNNPVFLPGSAEAPRATSLETGGSR